MSPQPLVRAVLGVRDLTPDQIRSVVQAAEQAAQDAYARAIEGRSA